jgi:hypothetical protein
MLSPVRAGTSGASNSLAGIGRGGTRLQERVGRLETVIAEFAHLVAGAGHSSSAGAARGRSDRRVTFRQGGRRREPF